MAVKEKINEILEKRKEKAVALRQRKVDFESISRYLNEFEAYKVKAGALKDERLRSKYSGIFNMIDISECIDRLYDAIDLFENAIIRFEREYISIATVGKARQGKSTFLQSIGNLEDDIIPAYDTGDCTGAVSVIYNDPDMPEGKVSAIIHFKEQEDLVTIVKAYIEQIDPEYLKKNEISFNKISSIKIGELEQGIEEGDATRTTALEHLKKIVEHYAKIRKLFGGKTLTLTDPNDIKKYVAQNNGKKATDTDVEYYYNYLAVARADIYCKFFEDCGKLVLVDTVGLEDTQVGIEEAMLNTVDNECDAAIVVTKPIAGAHQDDLKIYNLLRDNFKSRDMGRWLFYAANLHKGVNDNAVDTFYNSINDGNYDITFCKKVDCSNKQEVNSAFMQPLLETLMDNMDAIDNIYLDELNKKIAPIIRDLNMLYEKLPILEVINPGNEAALEAFQKGQRTYEDMTASLRNEVIELRELKKQPNAALWRRVQQILNDIDNLSPSADALQNIIRTNGSMSVNALWEAACNYVRNEITDMFNGIDDVMESKNLEFKNTLVKDMYDALHEIMGEDDDEDNSSVNMLEWLHGVMENVIGEQEQYRQIYKAFQFLYNFDFSIKENLIREVRRQLYSLNPVAEEYKPPLYDFTLTNAGNEVYYFLTSRLAVIEDELRHSLSKMYRTPNETFYAAAEEFYDRITFAISFKEGDVADSSGFVDMNKVWGNFFMQYSSKIWSENADRYSEVNELITQYNGSRLSLRDMIQNV